MTVDVPRRAIQRRRLTPDDVISFYGSRPGTKKKPLPMRLEPEEWTLTNTPTGLGDSVMLTDIERAAFQDGRRATTWLCTPGFRELQNCNPYHRMIQVPHWISLSAYQGTFDLGPGHNFQRARRLFGLTVDPKPSGCLMVPGAKRTNKVSIHLSAGSHAASQTVYHPNPRQVYPENLDVIRRFIRKHQELDFFEVGGDVLSDTVRSVRGSLTDSMKEMAECCLHIGIISGPYHVATALGIPTICIINFPAPWELILPTYKNIDIVEAEWLYPQSYILHQDHDSLHWPKFSEYTLEAAYQRETYPYEDPTEYLNLVSQ